jgi:hypothetical protein
MSASPATIGQKISPNAARNERVQVPARWRTGQIIVTAIIALLAIYYYTIRLEKPW